MMARENPGEHLSTWPFEIFPHNSKGGEIL